MPTCERCKRGHRACRVSAPGLKCDNCKKLNKECTFLEARKHGPKSGSLIEKAKALYGSVEDPASERASSGSASPPQYEQEMIHFLGRQDTSITSTENQLRRHEQHGALTLDLLDSVLEGVRNNAFEPPSPQVVKVVTIPELLACFDSNGQNSRGGFLSSLDEIYLAFYAALGAAHSTHSAILGATTSLPPIPLSPSSAASGSRLPSRLLGDYDLSMYGSRRDMVQRLLWRRCFQLCDDHGLFSRDTKSVSTLHLLTSMAAFNHGLSESEVLLIRRRVIQEYQSIVASHRSGFEDSHQRIHWFEHILASESRWTGRQLPLLPDEDILENMKDPKVNPQVFLSFDPSTIPLITDITTHHQLAWSSIIACERMMGVTAYSVNSRFDLDAETILSRMFTTLCRRKAWRATTYSEVTLDTGRTVRSTPFGLELPILTLDESVSNLQCHANLFSLLQDCDTTDGIERLRKECAMALDKAISEVSSEDTELWSIRRRLLAFDPFPGGMAALTGYLSRSSSSQEMRKRADNVNRIVRWCKRLSFEGQQFLKYYKQLEMAGLIPPSYEHKPEMTDELANRIIGGALSELTLSYHKE